MIGLGELSGARGGTEGQGMVRPPGVSDPSRPQAPRVGIVVSLAARQDLILGERSGPCNSGPERPGIAAMRSGASPSRRHW